MMGPSHRVAGALAGAGWATWQGQPLSVVAMTALVATATSNGPASPDGDQTQLWRTATRLTPAWVRRHRGILHWWGIPAAAWFAVSTLDPLVQWAAYALIVGWASHLAGDAIFGKVPIDPFGRIKVGLGLDTGGILENGGRLGPLRIPSLTRALMGAALAWLLLGAPTSI
jgi:hypothetical protein